MTPTYAARLEQGQVFQDYVVSELYRAGLPVTTFTSRLYQHTKGESANGIEIKNDTRYHETGNLYVEVAEKSDPDNNNYVPSGIYRKDNSWLWIIGDENKLFLLSKRQLQVAHRSKQFREVTTPTSKGFLLPVAHAESFWAVRVIEPKKQRDNTT